MNHALQIVSEKLEGSTNDKAKLKLWLRLLSCTIRIENSISGRLRAQFDTTLPRFDVMAALDRAPQGLTMGELSKWLMVSNGNVTGVVGRLVADGLVERRAGVKDRRVQHVKLTTEGERVFRKMAEAHEQWIDELFSSFTGREIRDLTRQLGKLKKELP